MTSCKIIIRIEYESEDSTKSFEEKILPVIYEVSEKLYEAGCSSVEITMPSMLVY